MIPYRHPAEVGSSSRARTDDKVALWQNYLVAALATAHELRCPTMLVPYHAWLNATAAETQFRALHAFLKCAGVAGIAARPPFERLHELVRPGHQHHSVSSPAVRARFPELPVAVRCTWDWLQMKARHPHREEQQPRSCPPLPWKGHWRSG